VRIDLLQQFRLVGSLNFAIANLQKKFELYERAVEIILLNFTLAPMRRNVRVNKGIKMLLAVPDFPDSW
jgi:hypothetical protein